MPGDEPPDAGPKVHSGDGGPEDAAAPTCSTDDLSLGWPIAGDRGVAWEVTDYFDLDPGPGEQDYTGAKDAAAKTYDGHPGTDISIANFRIMDEGVEVVAVAPGTIVDVVDHFFDRSKAIELPQCNKTQNYIAILDPVSGYRHEYLHIRTGSAKVRIGDKVKRGKPIALVGSSGCSRLPHVHLNVIDCEKKAIDPFQLALFEEPPKYWAPLRIMDAFVRRGAIDSDVDRIADPGALASEVTAGEALGAGLIFGAGRDSEEVRILVNRPDHSNFTDTTVKLSAAPRITYAFADFVPDAHQGTWQVEVLYESSVLQTLDIPVKRKKPHEQKLVLDIAASDLTKTLSDQAELGFEPRIVDGYVEGSAARFNLVFDPGPPRELRHSLTAEDMTEELEKLAKEGYGAVQVDAYESGAGARYAAIFAKATGMVSYFGLTPTQYSTNLTSQSGLKMIPVSVAIVGDGSTRRIAASFAKNAGLTFQSILGTAGSDLDSISASQRGDGRYPTHLHGSDSLAAQQLSAIWSTWKPGDYVLSHDLDESGLIAQHTSAQAAGLVLVDLSATSTSGGVLYAALWLAQAHQDW